MKKFLSSLTRHELSGWPVYAVSIAALVFITLFRLVVTLDTAPFLLFLPAVFLIAIAFGRGPGLVGVLVSSVLAGAFFDHPGASWWQLTRPQWIALAEYIIVGCAMVWVCYAIRRLRDDVDHALERMQKSEAELRTVLDTVPVGIMLAEAPSGRVIGRNRKLNEIIGISESDAQSFADYTRYVAFDADGQQIKPHDYPLARVIAGEAEPSLQARYRHEDGHMLWVEILGAPIRDAEGTITGAVVTLADIDARKRAEATQLRLTDDLRQRTQEAEAAREAAEAANRAKSAFLANMSHELRTPLSAVIGYTELIEEENEDAAVQADLGKIKTNAKHLLSLINDVLDLSKVEANKMDVVIETLELAPFLADVGTTVETLVKAKGNVLELDLGDGLGTMTTDGIKLRQCLFNLLGNAAKFTEGGRVTLHVRREGDWLVFAVRDTGIGMTPDQLARLFQRFTQADESTTRKFGGTGLGLALTRAFARLLGGDVEVTSTEGSGSCFTLRLPAAMANAVEREGVAGDIEASAAPRDLVLVIDDEISQRDLLSRFLVRQRFAVRSASDGRTGLELARALKPRVILLDVMMPEVDGWAVLKALKADPETSDIPVVIVSFVAEPKFGAALGAMDTLAKPVDWGKLKRLLDGLRASGGDVLVVDDDPDLRQRLRYALERSGWSVREAGDGAQALAEVDIAAPHLVVLDLTMPVMDGFSFLHRLRARPGAAAIPVVVLTARDITTADREALADAQRVIRKGDISLGDLTAEIGALHQGDADGLSGDGRQAEPA